ncbi:hypothetical protein QLX08_006524 [Tetragonisca angustula]|uniref:Uncharacterized protein n=1 Tax=Tetragonisca angustula TaxID=166442 RepID=A0AAW0ZVF6_9HYME
MKFKIITWKANVLPYLEQNLHFSLALINITPVASTLPKGIAINSQDNDSSYKRRIVSLRTSATQSRATTAVRKISSMGPEIKLEIERKDTREDLGLASNYNGFIGR